MADPADFTMITEALAKVTLKDGGVPAAVDLPNLSKIPRANVSKFATCLEVVYYRRRRTVELGYNNKEDAEAAVAALDGTSIREFKLVCAFKQDRSQLSSRKARKFHACLRNVTETITRADISEQLPEKSRSPKFWFQPLNGASDQDMTASLRQHVQDAVGTIHAFKEVDTKGPFKLKVEIAFQAGAQNLAATAARLNHTEVGGRKILVTENLSLHLRINFEVYLRRVKALKGIAGRAWHDHKVKVGITLQQFPMTIVDQSYHFIEQLTDGLTGAYIRRTLENARGGNYRVTCWQRPRESGACQRRDRSMHCERHIYRPAAQPR